MKQMELRLAPAATALLPMAPAKYGNALDSYTGKNGSLSAMLRGADWAPEIADLWAAINDLKDGSLWLTSKVATEVKDLRASSRKMQSELLEAYDPERHGLSKRYRAIAQAIADRHYDGMCALCRTKPAVHWDHWRGRNYRKLHDGWLTCEECNAWLRTPGDPRRELPEVAEAFSQYQAYVKAWFAKQGALWV